MEKEVFDRLSKRMIEISIIVYLASVVLLTVLAQTDFGFVFIGLLPLLIYLIIFNVFFIKKIANNLLLWTLPFFFALMLYFLWRSGELVILNRMEGLTLAAINLILCYIANFFFIMFYTKKTKPKTKKQKDKHEEHRKRQTEVINRLRQQVSDLKRKQEITEKNFSYSLRSIEDKCKAINFVIGRVYSDKKGANKTIRDKLRIDREFYNAFSEITSKNKDYHKLQPILDKIYTQLRTFDVHEKDLFKLSSNPKIPLKRDIHGNDRIIDVMARNDKDPIVGYVTEAKEVLIRINDFLKKRK